jgi:hypothetical protein
MRTAASRVRISLVVLVSCLVASCATHVPLEPAPNAGPVAVQTQRIAHVVVAVGVADGTQAWTRGSFGMMVPTLDDQSHPHLQFNVEDQRIFVDSLRKDLERLGIFASARNASLDEPSDYGVVINFLRTFHIASFHEYMLNVELTVRGGPVPLVKRYGLLSYQGEPWYKRWITNASEGKTMAARKLSELLIHDISEYVRATELARK